MHTKNHNHMVYSSWDTKWGWQNFLRFFGHFLPFQLSDNPENQNFKTEERTWDYYNLHICIINENHIMYDSWGMECNRDNFLSFQTIFCPFTPLWTQKIKFLEKWTTQLKTLSFQKVYHIWLSNDLWFLRYEKQHSFLSFWTVCCLFTPCPPPLPILTTLKIKILKNWNPGDIITLHMCTVNDNHMMYSSVLLFSW